MFQRPRGRVNCQTHARARRKGAMHGENLRKFTETRARAARALCIDFAAAKNTVAPRLPPESRVYSCIYTKFSTAVRDADGDASLR